VTKTSLKRPSEEMLKGTSMPYRTNISLRVKLVMVP
jgi:hypothetical protein